MYRYGHAARNTPSWPISKNLSTFSEPTNTYPSSCYKFWKLKLENVFQLVHTPPLARTSITYQRTHTIHLRKRNSNRFLLQYLHIHNQLLNFEFNTKKTKLGLLPIRTRPENIASYNASFQVDINTVIFWSCLVVASRKHSVPYSCCVALFQVIY